MVMVLQREGQRRFDRRRRQVPMSDINVTPMVDVMLVLLVIFMVAAPLLTVGVQVDLPRTKASPIPGQDEPLTVTVDAEGRIYVQETMLELEAMVPRLVAITGANPFKTMMLTWKYTLPAFLVPFTFTLSPEGLGVLLQAPLADIVRTVTTAAIGILALAMGLGGWLRQEATKVERTVAVAGGLLLFYATTLTDVLGAALFVAAIALHVQRTPAQKSAVSR